MRRWKQRARRAEAKVAALECDVYDQAQRDAEASEHVSTMVAESDAQAEAFYTALEQVRDADHGHPRDSAGRRVPSHRCEVCRIIAEVGV